jgi:hypothetical protein
MRLRLKARSEAEPVQADTAGAEDTKDADAGYAATGRAGTSEVSAAASSFGKV